jgi:hypothetical protein
MARGSIARLVKARLMSEQAGHTGRGALRSRELSRTVTRSWVTKSRTIR